MEIVRPIFLIGSGRSGSSVLYEALAVHPELGWIPNYWERFPGLAIAALLPRVYDLPLLRLISRGEKKQRRSNISFVNRYLPTPGEPYALWSRWCGEKIRRDYLVGVVASPDEKRLARAGVNWTLRAQGKKRFLAKFTGPSRIEYLRSIFPDALFIHLVRDGRVVSSSLLRTEFWQKGGGLERPWWGNGLPEGWEDEWAKYDRSPLALAAMQWRTVMDICEQERRLLAPGQYLEVKYEDFVVDPPGTANRIQSFCGLELSARVTDYVGQADRYQNMNERHFQRMSPEELRVLEAILGECLERNGYQLGATA